MKSTDWYMTLPHQYLDHNLPPTSPGHSSITPSHLHVPSLCLFCLSSLVSVTRWIQLVSPAGIVTGLVSCSCVSLIQVTIAVILGAIAMPRPEDISTLLHPLVLLPHSLNLGWVGQWWHRCPIRAEHSIAAYSQHFVKLWVSAVTFACSRRNLYVYKHKYLEGSLTVCLSIYQNNGSRSPTRACDLSNVLLIRFTVSCIL